MPKSRNIALATIFPPILLGISPVASRPSAILHRYFNPSSDFLTETVVGTCEDHDPRLLSNWHWPVSPSLTESAIGVISSSVKVAHPALPREAKVIRMAVATNAANF